MENSQSKHNSTFEMSQEERYDNALKRVQKIKGFYIHLIVYVLVNSGLIVMRIKHFDTVDTNFWNWQTFNTAFFWGIGLVAHGASVFGKEIFLGKDWEKRKLDQFLKEEDEKKQKWE